MAGGAQREDLGMTMSRACTALAATLHTNWNTSARTSRPGRCHCRPRRRCHTGDGRERVRTDAADAEAPHGAQPGDRALGSLPSCSKRRTAPAMPPPNAAGSAGRPATATAGQHGGRLPGCSLPATCRSSLLKRARQPSRTFPRHTPDPGQGSPDPGPKDRDPVFEARRRPSLLPKK